MIKKTFEIKNNKRISILYDKSKLILPKESLINIIPDYAPTELLQNLNYLAGMWYIKRKIFQFGRTAYYTLYIPEFASDYFGELIGSKYEWLQVVINNQIQDLTLLGDEDE